LSVFNIFPSEEITSNILCSRSDTS